MMSQLAKLSRLKRQTSGKRRLISCTHGGIDPLAGINEKNMQIEEMRGTNTMQMREYILNCR